MDFRRRLPIAVVFLLCLVVSSQVRDYEKLFKKHKIGGPIKTIVVLVMENRSFDHMLSWLKSTQPNIDGLTGTESNKISATDPDSPEVYVSDEAIFVDSDPGHSFQAIREQIFGSNDTQRYPETSGSRSDLWVPSEDDLRLAGRGEKRGDCNSHHRRRAKTVDAIEETIVAVSSTDPPALESNLKTEDSKTEQPKIEDLKSEPAAPPLAPEEVYIWGIKLLEDDKTDVVLLKFLRARDFKVKEAFTMIQNTVR
ncbi:Non-specific phospholipase C1 [Linum perenne]